MSSTVHVFDYFENPPTAAPVTVVFGDSPFLRQLAIADLQERVVNDPDTPIGVHDGDSVSWRDVLDELQTVSLFDTGGRRAVIIRGADNFVTAGRAQLEDYVAAPVANSVLILDVTKWAANTKLYKLVGAQGLQLACRAPQTASRGGRKSLDTARVVKWMVQRTLRCHNATLEPEAAQQLLDLIGPQFGLLDQELAKLALYTESDQRISARLVQKFAGDWNVKSIWAILDAALDGDTATALSLLNRMFVAGQDPNALMGPILWSLRRLAGATRAYQRAERRQQRVDLKTALQQAGVKPWELQRCERRLRRLGRARAAALYQQLLQVDLALKGSHSSKRLARHAIEDFLLRISLPA